MSDTSRRRPGLPTIKWFANVTEIVPPRRVTILLALIAGFVDVCTFLGLYRLFVAQLTGSYVVAGTALFAPGWPEATVLLAGPVFFAAGMAATFMAITAGANGLPSLAFALGLETALLAAFTGIMIIGAPFPESLPFSAFIAALLGLSAMGVQSALVRLLLRGVGSTNVMTTNTTQIAIEATRAALTWALRHSDDPNITREHEAARRGLSKSVPLPLGFFVGIMAGALGYGFLGSWVLVLPTGIAGALTAWAFRLGTEGAESACAPLCPARAMQPNIPT
jgi:uncharacterized membrane protein YoaK (UPF0700 family)